MSAARRVGPFLLVLALCAAPMGCGDDDASSTTPEGGEGSAGGEAPSDSMAGMQTPPGSVAPREDGLDPDDLNAPAGPSSPGGAEPDAPDATTAPEAPAEPPPPPGARWGATRSEQCQPPPRHTISDAARAQFEFGVRAAAAGNDAEAQQAFQRAISADANAFAAIHNLGILADRAGNEGQALEAYRRALRVQGDYERAAEGIVTIHLRRGSVPDALAFIEPLARRYATNLHLQALYAEVLVRAERYEPAWNAARAALRCNERFVPALKALVRASLAQGRRRLADTILEQAIEIDGDDPELHYIQGTLYRESAERLRDALDEFEAAVRLRPDYVDARMALGVQLLSGGRYEDALGHFQVVVRLMPGSAAAHLNVGDAQRSLRQWDPAKASFERVLRLDPNNAPAHFNLGLMHYAIGLEREQQEQIDAMQLARQHFVQYRNLMGPRLARDDPSEQYLSEVDRTIQRAQRAIERAARRAAQQAAREAAAAEAGGADGAAGDGGEGG